MIFIQCYYLVSKKTLKCIYLAFKMPKLAFKSYEMDPRLTTAISITVWEFSIFLSSEFLIIWFFEKNCWWLFLVNFFFFSLCAYLFFSGLLPCHYLPCDCLAFNPFSWLCHLWNMLKFFYFENIIVFT